MGIRGVPPGITDPNLRGFLQDIRNALAGVSEKVTKLSTTTTTSGGGGNPGPGGGGGNPPPDGGGPPPTSPPGDGLNPPPPTSLTAKDGTSRITLSWDNPVIADLADTEIWGKRILLPWDATKTYANGDYIISGSATYVSIKKSNLNHAITDTAWWVPSVAFGPTTRSKLGASKGSPWIFTGADNNNLGQETWAFWVRNHDTENLFSDFYPTDDVGVIGHSVTVEYEISNTNLWGDLETRITVIDSPTGLIAQVDAEVQALQGEVDQSIADLKNGVTDITVTTSSGTTTLKGLKASTENSAAGIVAINTVSSTSTSAIARSLWGLTAAVNDPTTGISSKSSITQLNQAVSDLNGASATQLNNINAQFTSKQAQIDTKASLTQLTQAKSDIYGSSVSQFSNINASFQSQAQQIASKATITDINNAKSDIYGSSVSQFSNIQATFNSLNDNINGKAGVTFVNEAVANAKNEAIATSTQQVYSTLGGNSATVQQKVSSWNGAAASYSVKIDNNGQISGFGLSSESVYGQPTSYFIVRADRFAIGRPGTGQSDTPFSVDTSTGIVRLNSANISSVIQSTNFNGNSNWIASNPGDTGWAINQAGEAVFNTAIVRKPSNIASSAYGASAKFESSQYTDGGSSYEETFGPYYYKANVGQTTNILLTLDCQTSLSTYNIEVRDGANNVIWVAYNKRGAAIESRFFSGSTSFYAHVNQSYVYLKVYMQSGGGSMGMPRFNIFEIVS